jgi:mono/diheme cytochrome c family protein
MRVAAGLYRQYCLTCHGPSGNGSEMRASMPRIPDFTNRGYQERVSNPQLAASILNGKDLMPTFAGRLDQDQARDLVAYLRAFGPVRPAPKEPATPPSDFEKRFRQLQERWDELEKQMKEVSRPAPRP